MIPFLELPPIPIGSRRVSAFPLLVLTGILVATWIIRRRARRLGLAAAVAGDMILAMLVGGFLGAVAFKGIYTAEQERDVTYMRTWGITSFGGIFFGLASSRLYFAARRLPALPYLELAAFAFPFGWIFGRLGCAFAHDHPGIRAEGWLAVAYPGGARYDLGLLELLFTTAIAGAWLILDRHRRVPGFFLSRFLAVYSIFRIAIDRLHVDPPRWVGLPVDTWSGLVLGTIGILCWFHTTMLASVDRADKEERR